MYVDDYRELDIQTRKKIYTAYADILNKLSINQDIRDELSGFLFENKNDVFTIKIYRPDDITDERLIYSPIEITRIGKNSKLAIPVKVYGTTKTS